VNKEKSPEFKNIVKLMYLSGISIKQIAVDKYTTQKMVNEILIEKRILVKDLRSSNILGSKTEPYYKNEKEQLIKPHYTYDDLSPKEKNIYESRENKSEILQNTLRS
jgi:hypothetical protein